MSTTDANGIVFLEETDAISPFHTLVNTLQSGTSAAVQNAANGPRYAANNTERDALLSTYGSSATNPLWVYRGDARILERHNGTSWQSVTGTITGVTSVPAFSLPSAIPPATILTSTVLTHPFTGEVVVSADLVGDAVIGANSSARFLLTVNGLSRPGWTQNFGGGLVRDSPNIHVTTTVTSGTPVSIQVSVADVGTGGTSAAAASLQVEWTIRPGRGAA